jgi:type IV secretory pathway TraG/TraD family ATPase VirD4
MSAPRPRDPVTTVHGGEIAFLVLAGTVLAAALTALAGIGAASALFGSGWSWPHVCATGVHELAALVRGQRPVPQAAGETATYACLVFAELLLLALAITVAVLVARYRRPGDARGGMASRAEAATALGARRLRRARRQLRPDLTFRGVPPTELGWRLGTSRQPRGVELWVRYDRTVGVYGAQGSGKTLDLLTPALLAHPGPALVTLTKLDDLLLTIDRRRSGERPVAVLDPFGVAPGEPELVWDPIVGCVDPMLAERRATAFGAGTVTGGVAGGRADNAARFYAHETAKVLQGFFHAAALTGRSLDQVMTWIANPVSAEQPIDILRQHPHAARHWDGLLAGALGGSPDTVANTVTPLQQAMALFFQPAIRDRCVPGPRCRATDIADVLARGGTLYLLGREDPYASASPLMTAVAEHILDTALAAANSNAHGRLCPPLLACLDELPSTAPLPTLRTRMANERALGIWFLYAAQTWRQIVVCYGEDEARSLLGLTNNLILFGGGKDIAFYREMSDLLGVTRITRRTVTDGPSGAGTSRAGEDTPILRPAQLRLLPDRHALVVAENAPPILARLRRCATGRAGAALLRDQDTARARVRTARARAADLAQRTAAALAAAAEHLLTPDEEDRW